jgi:hypothetical protein
LKLEKKIKKRIPGGLKNEEKGGVGPVLCPFIGQMGFLSHILYLFLLTWQKKVYITIYC